MTADQLASRIGKTRSSVSDHIRQLKVYGVLHCLNPAAGQSRLYWLTSEGTEQRATLGRIYGGYTEAAAPDLDWRVYGDLCFRHRRAVLLAMRGQMRPPLVKRRALANDPHLRMSVDNCREVLYWMRDRGVVRAVRPRRRRFSFYELTEVGRTCQELLQRVSGNVYL